MLVGLDSLLVVLMLFATYCRLHAAQLVFLHVLKSLLQRAKKELLDDLEMDFLFHIDCVFSTK